MFGGHKVDRDRRRFIVGEQENEPAVLNLLMNLVDPDDTLPIQRGADRRLVGVHHEPRPNPHGADHLPPRERRKAPDILRACGLDGDAMVIGKLRYRLGRRPIREVARRRAKHPPHLADTEGDQRRILEYRDPQRDIYSLVDQIGDAVEEQKADLHRGMHLQELADDRAQEPRSEHDRRGDRQHAVGRRVLARH
jgi:hypothetical protein